MDKEEPYHYQYWNLTQGEKIAVSITQKVCSLSNHRRFTMTAINEK